jgi:hypothetical protein
MRSDLLRWGAISSLLLAILFAVVLALGFTMGADVYQDSDVGAMLTDVNKNQEVVALWAVLGMTTSLLYFPAALGFFYAAREEDRPYLVVPGGLFTSAAALSVVGYAAALMLPEVAENYVQATGPGKDALLHDGENLQSVFLILGGVPLVVFALGMVAIGVLSLRSGFSPRWFGWATIAVGIAGAIPFVGFVVIVPGRVLWLLISGIIMLRHARNGQASTDSVPQPSPLPA